MDKLIVLYMNVMKMLHHQKKFIFTLFKSVETNKGIYNSNFFLITNSNKIKELSRLLFII